MARYAYACIARHETVRVFPMGEAPAAVACATCAAGAGRVFGDVQFTEDRTRFFRNAITGTHYSYSLGQEYPDTRTERDRLLTEKGWEPVTPGNEPAIFRENRQYLEHLRTGGERDRAFEATPPEPPTKGTVTVRSQMDAANFKVPS